VGEIESVIVTVRSSAAFWKVVTGSSEVSSR
jgi:hypothetical protein